jgi:hypothetical protein
MGSLPVAARVLSTATEDGVAAVRSADPAALADAVARLSTRDFARASLVLGGVLRALLEHHHPDGLDGEDVRAVLTHCVRATAGWESEVDPTALLVVLTGALGLADPDEQPPLPPATVARAALLLITDLLGPAPLATYLTPALTELSRAETIELP